jgi:hypothetical protein
MVASSDFIAVIWNEFTNTHNYITFMEEYRKDDLENREKEIAYSRTVKAGKRIYYLDVKRSRNEDLYLSLTESKKKISGNPENPDITYEKHKIFLYREDLSKFTEALIDVIRYMQDNDIADSAEAQANGFVADALENAVTEKDLTLDLDDEGPAIKLNLEDFE